MAELDVDSWDAMIDVNLRGVLHGIAAALPVFRRQGRGHFVTTVSTSGLKIVPRPGGLRRHQERGPHAAGGAAPGVHRRRPAHDLDLARLRAHRTRRLHRRPRHPGTGAAQDGDARHRPGRRGACRRVRDRAARRRRDRRHHHPSHHPKLTKGQTQCGGQGGIEAPAFPRRTATGPRAAASSRPLRQRRGRPEAAATQMKQGAARRPD